MKINADVCICGGGPSGLIAAVAAARSGAKTVLLEKYGFAGGMATAGLVGPISKFNFNGKRVVEGIPLEFAEMMQSRGGDLCCPEAGCHGTVRRKIARRTEAQSRHRLGSGGRGSPANNTN
jgi:glycine/D-amino acid oxidase-like deaminating enzyme